MRPDTRVEQARRYVATMGQDAADRQARLAGFIRTCCDVRKDEAHRVECRVARWAR